MSGRVFIEQTAEGIAEAIRSSVNGNGDGNGYHDVIELVPGARATPREQALEMLDLGYWPIAIYPVGARIRTKTGEKIAKGKEPIGKAWGLERRSREQLLITFRDFPAAGVGFGLGPERGPGGLWQMDIEGDGPLAEQSRARLFGGKVPHTPTSRSRRGDHTYLADKQETVKKLLESLAAAGAKERTKEGKPGVYHLEEFPDLEFRLGGFKEKDGAVKQVQTVLPPTTTDDFARTWIIGPAVPLSPIPESVFDLLDDIIERKGMQAEHARTVEDWKRNGSPLKRTVPADVDDDEPRARMTQREAQLKWAQQGLAIELENFAGQREGNRHAYLLTLSCNLASKVKAGVLTNEECLSGLKNAAIRNGMGQERFDEVEEAWRTAPDQVDAAELSHVGLECLEKLEDDQEDDDQDQEGTGASAGARPQQLGRVDSVRLARLKCTDLGNGERLVARHGDNFRFCYPWGKFLAWDSTRWRVDNTAAVKRMAKRTVRKMYDEGSTITDEKERKNFFAWVFASESKRAIDAMIGLGSSEEGIPVLPEDLNRDPWLLNCTNGTVNLKTGQLRKHDRADLITVLCPTEFDPSATCPTWGACLETIFAGDRTLIQFIQRLFGLALTGEVSEQILPICWGEGSNGKSTILKTILDVMGPDYAITAAPGMLIVKHNESHPTERADLYGKRLVVDMESAEDARLNETLVKQLTGSDRIRARRMREDHWEFDPTHKLMMCTNHKPAVKETKHAIWRRLKLIPFTVKLEGEKEDKRMPEKLRSEFPGILAWAVRGCLEWQKNGLGVPEVVTKATSEYRESENIVSSFISECCVTGGNYREKSTHLYHAYRTFMERSGEGSVSQKRFGEAMTELGYERLPNNGIWYLGIALRSAQSTEAKADSNCEANT